MPPTTAKLILASRSPRRRELLVADGFRFEVVVPHESAESALCRDERPADYVARLAWQKAADVAARTEAGIVVACDTVAECEGSILGKPRDEGDARGMLSLLSGQLHRVYSGLCVWQTPGGVPHTRVDCTVLNMDELSDAQLDEYLAGGQWRGKAGAFGFQDRHDWVRVVEGSESNVVGLPMELLREMLADVGFRAKSS